MWSWSQLNLGQSALPQVTAHPPSELLAYEGDHLDLKLVLDGSANYRIRWVYNSNTLCEKEACLVKTTDWGVGDHKLTVTLSHSEGESSLVLTIKLLPRAALVSFRQRTPLPTYQPLAWKSLAYEKIGVQSLGGEAYAYSDLEVLALDRRKQQLAWQNQKLITPAGVWLHFGLLGVEEYFLGPASQAILAAKQEDKLLLLEQGQLRVRHKNEKNLPASLLIGQWLQIDATSPCEYVVHRQLASPEQGESVLITVLRGQLRLVRRQEQASLELGVVEQERTLLVTREPSSFHPLAFPPLVWFRDLIAQTSPESIISREGNALSRPEQLEGTEGSRQAFYSSKEALPPRWQAVAKRASQALADRHYFLALEYAYPFRDEAADHYSLALLIGAASKGLFLFEQAKEYLELATSLDSKDKGLAYALLGEIRLLEGDWQGALNDFSYAHSPQAFPPEKLAYYQGLAKRQLGFRRASAWFLTKSRWLGGPEALQQSTIAHLDAIEREKDLRGELVLSVLRDNNPLQLAEGEEAGDGSGIGWEHSLRGRLALRYRLFELLQAHGELAGEGTIEQPLTIPWAGRVTPRLSLPLAFSLTGEALAASAYALSLEPEAGFLIWGGERLHDILGLRWGLTSRRWSVPFELSYHNHMHLDPNPFKEKVWDPFLYEETAIMDAGVRERGVAVGLSLWEKERLAGHLGLSWTRYAYRYRESAGSSHDFLELEARGTYQLDLRWQFQGQLAYGQRRFNELSPARHDQLLRLGGSVYWYFLPAFKLGLEGLYRRQDSSIGSRQFQAWQLGTVLAAYF